MKKYIKFLSIIPLISLVFIAGCSTASTAIPPSPLINITQQLVPDNLWSTSVGDGNDGEYINLTPTIYGDEFFSVSYDGHVLSANKENSKQNWYTSIQGNISSSPAVSKKYIAFGDTKGNLYLLNKKDGTVKWKAKLSSSLYSKPLIYKQNIFIKANDGTLFSFDLETGNENWNQSTSTTPLQLAQTSQLIINDNTLYGGLSTGEFWAFNIATGQEIWSIPVTLPVGSSDISRMVDISANPVIVDNIAYVMSFNGNFVAINLKNNSIIWTKKLSGYQNFSIKNNNIFLTNSDGYILSIKARNGEVNWEQEVLKGRMLSSPAIIDKYLITGDYQGYLQIFNTDTGAYLSRYQVDDSGILSNIIVDNESMIVQMNNGLISKFKFYPVINK